MPSTEWDGAPVVRGDTVIVAARHAWFVSQALNLTERQQRHNGTAIYSEFVALVAAFAQASAAWRGGDTFAEANVRIRKEDDPVTVEEMTTKEVSKVMGIGVRAVQARAARGTLPSRCVGRALLFDPADVERALEKVTRA
jgi:excisionase family DNA binding protein